ncbi:MAG: hypothetical protein K0Q76_3132 [Panacagrimonas sp.]|jgi:hypothetical protein|nr:DUF2007 domain-containing protein [Panacagrimonas sp.]MCC2658024.1 hypothetical protein [Panacagrimonas sp.]
MPAPRPPTVVYLAADPIEAEIVRNMLESERIPADVLGSLLWSGRGDLAADAYPRVVVRDPRDEARATEVLDAYRSRNAAEVAPWTCGGCGEHVPGNFAACWACGHALG